MVIIYKIKPITCFRLFFSFITANFSAILRDFIINAHSIKRILRVVNNCIIAHSF